MSNRKPIFFSSILGFQFNAFSQFHHGFDNETDILEHDLGEFRDNDVEYLFRSKKCATNHSSALVDAFEAIAHPVRHRHVLNRVSDLLHWHHHVRVLL